MIFEDILVHSITSVKRSFELWASYWAVSQLETHPFIFSFVMLSVARTVKIALWFCQQAPCRLHQQGETEGNHKSWEEEKMYFFPSFLGASCLLSVPSSFTQARLLHPIAVVPSQSKQWIQCAISSSSMNRAHFVICHLPSPTFNSPSSKIRVPSLPGHSSELRSTIHEIPLLRVRSFYSTRTLS